MPTKRVFLVDESGNQVLLGPSQLPFDSNQRLAVVLPAATDGGDGWAAAPINFSTEGSADARPLAVTNWLLNGTNRDRERNNYAETILASAARTATVSSADFINYNNKGLILFVDVTAITATPVITILLQGKDPISDKYFTVWTVAVDLTGVGITAYLFYPGTVAGSYTEAVNIVTPRNWRVNVSHADTDSITYSIAALLML